MPQVELVRVRDTCNVWVLKRGRDGVCVDFGAGTVLDRLDELGIDRITDVLVTHAHREVAQGLRRATEHGARVWVPPVERDLFTAARRHWSRIRPEGSYEVRQETLTPLDDIEIAGTVDEYRTRAYGGIDVYTLPTPGHTMGSVTYLVDVDGRRAAFCGDLVHDGGRFWSLAATQWSYSGVGGQAATLLSLNVLLRESPAVVLPAHGEPIEDPPADLRSAERRLRELMELRRVEEMPFAYERWLDAPWRLLLPHLLLNTTSESNSYALLSETGAALIVDWGYDLWTGWPMGGERHHCRPLVQSIAALRRDHGVERVEALVTTHYHDDHVAGANLLRDVEGTEVWAAENMVPMLERPDRFDLPCLWYDPIPVDRSLPFGEPIAWQEYELTLHPLPGHTLFAAAIEFDVDGRKVVATGDQQDGRWVEGEKPEFLNYQYRNGFRYDDFADSAELYRRLRPDLLISGHWLPRPVTDDYLALLRLAGRELARLHRALLPLESVDFGGGGFGARIEPYRSEVAPGGVVDVEVTVRNPFARPAATLVSLVVPLGWDADPAVQCPELPPHGEMRLSVRVRVGPAAVRRARIAADLTVDGVRFGQQAEALVTVR
jgi:glyoxylase-like metal-dependent hydrolase (beta-lactamase superfamily II)